MASEIRLPDIGDFKDVPIIEIHVKPGQTVAKEEVLLTLESDKATLDVPAPEAGVIGEIKVKIGDKVSEGSLLATWAGEGAAAAAPPAAKAPAPSAAAAPPAAKAAGADRRSRPPRLISNATYSCSARAQAAQCHRPRSPHPKLRHRVGE